ncbi:MAG: LysE family translocator [Pseudomonadota bacterium]
MTFETWMLFVATVLVFMSTPGPSQLLMLSNSLGSGFRRAVFTATGDLSANFLQMLVAAVGLASIVASSRHVFLAVKWLGAAYLVYLGIKLILAKPAAGEPRSRAQRSRSSLYWQGFLTSAANPKAVIFFAALFPQFIDPSQALAPQFAALSATYIAIDGLFLCGYGAGADWIGRRLRPAAHAQLNRVSGTFLIGAAVLLGAKDIETR